jgi:diguanylate cyclase (GGDEF)-like protein
VDAEERLSSVLGEFARTLVTDFPIQAILDHLVLRIVDVLPITAAGVTLISPGSDPQYIAASDASALRFEKLQSELAEGPCLAAYRLGEAVSVPDLSRDDRFPAFAARALEAGLVAVFTFPLRQGGEQLGALDLYRSSAGALSGDEMTAAQTLADVATAYLVNARARADLLETSEHAKELALHDALTGLPNRALVIQLLEHSLLRCRRSEKTVAVLYADLDDFKAVNDTHGHHIGDELLVAVAERLRSCIRPGDVVGRLSGDEFIILCEDLDDPGQVEPLAARISRVLGGPYNLSIGHVQVGASIGIAFSGRDCLPDEIIQEADTAMYQAKRRGGGHHTVVDLREQTTSNHRAGLSLDLPGALSRGEVRNAYQPIVATIDGRMLGVEALLRWTHPVHGPVEAQTTVHLAEQGRLISEIGRWVLERACLDLRTWQRHDPTGNFEVAVNVSAHQIMGPNFALDVAAVLQDTVTDPGLITLELTESVFLQDHARALVVLEDLKGLGVKLALDDFGTGYSSLTYLNSFPIDVVKIDQSFVSGLGRPSTSKLIVGAVVDLAHRLGMAVVAEGVESAREREQVQALDCESCQGYYFARPMWADDVDALLEGAERLPVGPGAAVVA